VVKGLVFCNTEGGFLRISDVRRHSFLPILKRSALPTIRLYDLRHTVATLLLAADVNVKLVPEPLGHESIGITPRRYAHALPGIQQRAAHAIFRDSPTEIPRNQKQQENKSA
jgi:integrase